MKDTLPFVKKFDFRGVYGKDITDENAYYLGLALLRSLPLKKVLVGWDTRVSSRNLAMCFIQALQEHEVAISYLDTCPIDFVTAASFTYDYDLAVMFTGSHNPWDWTGLLMHTRRGDSVQGELVVSIVTQYHAVSDKPFLPHEVSLSNLEDASEKVEQLYAEKLRSLLPLEKIKPVSVVVDIGDGSGEKALNVLRKLVPQVSFTAINTRGVYNEESAHTADPSEIKNMQDLTETVRNGNHDGGFAFDSDADRVLVVDEQGTYINGSLMGSALMEGLLSAGSTDRKTGYAVDCGIAFRNTATELTLRYPDTTCTVLPVGRSLLRKMVRDGLIDLGIENVGHFYLKDFFMTDSGVCSIAIMLYWMSQQGALSTLFTKHPDGQREQLFVPVPTNQDDIIKNLEETFLEMYGETGLKKIEVDGLRFEMYKGGQLHSWFATRKSGYEPIQKYFYGSLDMGEFERLKKTVVDIVKANESPL